MTNKLTLKFELLNPPAGNFDKTNPPLGLVVGLDRENIGNFVIPEETRFRFSQLVDNIFHYYHHIQTNDENIVNIESIDCTNNSNYIIPVAVAYHPNDWTDLIDGKPTDTSSIFELINPIFLKDLQTGRAMLLIDQSVEGYHTDWLWSWFHDKCKKYSISPQAIIYVTGDQSSLDNYTQWSVDNNISVKLNIIPSVTLSMYIYQTYMRENLNINFDRVLEHKSTNADNLYLYDCTNSRPRPQRVYNYLHLKNAELIEDGNISIGNHPDWKTKLTNDQLNKYQLPPDIDTIILPQTIDNVTPIVNGTDQYWKFVERILDNVYLNSWVSLITESSYFKHEGSVFISEKTFKPIACMQPFIIVGSKHSLKYIKKLGYKTFDGFIDESYDDLEDEDRFLAIIRAVNQIKAIADKPAWYKSMKEILEYNHNLFMEIGTKKSTEHKFVDKYYFEYFKDKNVQHSLR